MPSILSNSDNFILTSDNQVDQIIYMASGSFTAPSDTITSESVYHMLGFAPLPILTWSTDPDFNISRESNLPAYDGSDASSIYVSNSITDTKFNMSAFNPTNDNLTIYWRVYALAPSNIDIATASTSSLADSFNFNSDYNYTKLLLSGYTDSATNTSITHNLGYRPQVMAWLEASGTIYQINNAKDIKVGTNDVFIYPSNIHYRIYADRQAL